MTQRRVWRIRYQSGRVRFLALLPGVRIGRVASSCGILRAAEGEDWADAVQQLQRLHERESPGDGRVVEVRETSFGVVG